MIDRRLSFAKTKQLIVGHVPRDLSKRFSEMLSAGKKIYAVVVGKRENKRKRGLEVPVI